MSPDKQMESLDLKLALTPVNSWTYVTSLSLSLSSSLTVYSKRCPGFLLLILLYTYSLNMGF